MANNFFLLDNQDIDIRENNIRNIIQSDIRVINSGEQYTVDSSSLSHSLRIKFFLDCYSITTPSKTTIYKVGKYFELEYTEEGYIFNSQGFLSFRYICQKDKVIPGRFLCSLLANDNISFYISAVRFEDSFFNPKLSWTNPENPNNIIDKIEKEFLPEGNTIIRIEKNIVAGDTDKYSFSNFDFNISKNTNNAFFTVSIAEKSQPAINWAYTGNQQYNTTNITYYNFTQTSGTKTVESNVGTGNNDINLLTLNIFGVNAYLCKLWTKKSTNSYRFIVSRT